MPKSRCQAKKGQIKWKKKWLDALENFEKAKNQIFKQKQQEFYTGMTEGTLKDRIYKHNFDFRHKNYRKRTSLSKYIWNLKEHNYNFQIKWKILALSKSYNPASKGCNLCTKEKFYIIFKPGISTLNEKNEILKKCPYRRKWIINENQKKAALKYFFILIN